MTSVGAATQGVRRAWGWVAALRAGEVTPWTEWQAAAEPAGVALPGAQQLELLRRLNVAAGPATGVPPALAERVLAADAPGRGRTDLPLLDAGPAPRFGPPAVDPGALADDELLRLAAGLLAEDLSGMSLPEEPPTQRRRPWTPSYRLAGDDWLVEPIRADLRRRARPERAHPARVYVVATDLATMLGHAWTSRAFAESGAGWTTWLGGFVEHDRLPHRADPRGPLGAWAARIGVHRTTLVLGPRRLPGRLRGWRRPAEAPPVTATGVDLVRRVSTTLGILVPAERRTALLRRVLLPRLPVGRADTVAVPARWHPWVREHADRLRREVRAGGYPVLGDPGRLLPTVGADGHDPDPTGVLGLALRLLLDPVTSTEETQ